MRPTKEQLRQAFIAVVDEEPALISDAKLVYQDIIARTKISSDAVGRLVTLRRRFGFFDVWCKTVSEDPVISYELELACNLLSVHDSQSAAEELVTAWWDKHNMPHDSDKLALVIYGAMSISEDYRTNRRKKLEAEKERRRVRRMESHTKPIILDSLRKGPCTLKELGSSPKIKMHLSRMVKSGEVVRVARGVYELAK